MNDVEALKHAYSGLTYSQFCRVINNREDEYAERKWRAFQDMMQNMAELGTFLERLIRAGSVPAKGEKWA